MGAIVPHEGINSRYLYWWLSSNYQNIRNMAGGDLRDGLNLELLGNIGCPMPREEEKTAIAAFLDHETAKIDALIEKQQRLIELLKEKRQAVISHAVTKGLNPNAPMKDSGVEWLGEVPAHWAVAKFKYLVVDSAAGPYGASLTKSMYWNGIRNTCFMGNNKLYRTISQSETITSRRKNSKPCVGTKFFPGIFLLV